jgi:hypothetical protein
MILSLLRLGQSVLDEARDLIKMVHDCIKEREEYEDRYEQKPQNFCKWCSFIKVTGGPCDVEIPKWKPKFARKKENYSDIDKKVKGQIELDNQDQFPEFD